MILMSKLHETIKLSIRKIIHGIMLRIQIKVDLNSWLQKGNSCLDNLEDKEVNRNHQLTLIIMRIIQTGLFSKQNKIKL